MIQGELAGHIGAGHGLCRRNPALNCALAVGQFVHLVDERATSALKTALTDLAGNLIRVVRGAGKADRIANQVNAFEDAFIGYRDATGRSPDGMVLGELLQYQEPDAICDDDRFEEVLIENAVCRAALQIVASTLLDQRTPRERALNELHDHLRRFEEVRKRARLRRQRLLRAAKAAAKKA